MISSNLSEINRMFMNVNDKQFLEMPDKTKEYMEYHRMYCYKS